MPRPGNGQSPRQGGSNTPSGRNSKNRGPDPGLNPDRGPRPHADICISEEVKIGINLAIERFRLNEVQRELEFPTSLTATERAYIHRIGDDLGYNHKSKGKGGGRYLCLCKKAEARSMAKSASFQLVKNSRYQINNMLQRFPVNNKERLELLPSTDKSQVNEVSKELARTATGRLNNGVSQVPSQRCDSDLQGFTQTLPINQYRDVILSTIRENQVCLVSGETGSGKTTQVPQMILDDCHSNKLPCRIFCTQPRRIAALSISERVATERGEKVGQTVGFQIRLESRVSPKTLLTFCTNGVLLRTMMGNEASLNTVTHVIVDEVHERDKFSDFLLITLREMTKRNPNLKIILMSATLNTELFVKYFNNCPVVSVPGNLFDVEEHFLEDILSWTGFTTKKMETYKKNMAKIARQNNQLSEWCNEDPIPRPARRKKQQKLWKYEGETDSEDSEREADDRRLLTDQLAGLGLGHEKEVLEPWVTKEMDDTLSDCWITGNMDLFSQIFHLIVSENVSVDYQHSETSITPLMIAAGRGFVSVIEQLLSMGADAGLKASNDWTAVDWAKKFQRDDIVALLEAHMLSCEMGSNCVSDSLNEDNVLSEADRERLTVYQHCWNDDKVDIDLIAALLHKIVATQPEGAVLIFLPGYDDIVALRNTIDEDARFGSSRYSLFLLHSAMQSTDQKKVFKPSPPGIRKIILATNIAETSITINDVVYVINGGKVKEKMFDALLQITCLKSNWISKASAKQRRGRAGRIRSGVCYHMFSRTRHEHMLDYATPELLRCPLQELCLQTKLLAPVNESIAEFLAKAPEPPPFLVTRSAVNVLKQMDALDHVEELTELGRHLADLPVEPHLGKMVLNAIVLKCLDPVLTIVCSLSYKDPFQLPGLPYQRREVNQIKKEFSASTYSDHMTLLRVFQSWQKARTDGWEKSFCARNYVSSAVMEMIVGMRAQLLGQLRASGFVRARGGGDIRDLNTNAENWAVVKAALCAGAYPSIIRVDKQKQKLVARCKEKVMTHMSSVLPQKQAIASVPSDWLFFEEMTRAGTVACVKCCTLVSPITVAIFAGPAKLPPDALKDPTEDELNDEREGFHGHGETSDSENEDPDDNRNSTLQLGDWLTFKVDAESASLALQLRQKWHCLFLRRMRSPSKPWSTMDEAVINAVVNVLTNEEQAIGLQQPAGIGQRPRPMSAESIMSGGASGSGHTGHMTQDHHDNHNDNSCHRFSTSAKKATSTPPKRKDFLSPKLYEDGSPSVYGSGKSTPQGSPQYLGDADAGPCRYFIMKCSSQKNIDMSVSKSAWATSKSNERKLNKAFQDGKMVYLIYSVQGSGHFQGYGKMSSIIGTDKSSDFNGQGGVFSVDWIKRGNVQFQMTHHLVNPWNENKRVQISRDGQELEPSIGEALLQLWERFPDNHSDNPSGASGGRWNDRYNQSYGPKSPSRGYNQGQSKRFHGNGHYQRQGQYESGGHYTEGEGHYSEGYIGDNQYYNQGYAGYNNWQGGVQNSGYDNGQMHMNLGHHGNPQGHYGYSNQETGYQRGNGYGIGSPGQRNSPVMILQRDRNQQQGGYQRGHHHQN